MESTLKRTWAEIDLDHLDEVRTSLPCLANRRSDIYGDI